MEDASSGDDPIGIRSNKSVPGGSKSSSKGISKIGESKSYESPSKRLRLSQSGNQEDETGSSSYPGPNNSASPSFSASPEHSNLLVENVANHVSEPVLNPVISNEVKSPYEIGNLPDPDNRSRHFPHLTNGKVEFILNWLDTLPQEQVRPYFGEDGMSRVWESNWLTFFASLFP